MTLALVAAPAAAREIHTGIQHPAGDAWAFENSDVPLDPAFRFGRLANGMRYILRRNATPAGTAVVRFSIEAGSLDETDDEQGFAHFLEHMAFNGSVRVPEGQMIALLEREGLAFGADTNASTGFERTTYKLDLPRSTPALIDTALMLMRETAGNLTISAEAVERERGVVLAEMRDRNSWSMRNSLDATRFFYPGSRYSLRFPIGTETSLNAATAEGLRAFYERAYVPARATLIVVGDFDVAAVEAGIVRHFNDWAPRTAQPRPDPGPISASYRGKAQVYVDPALSERVTIQRNGPWLAENDTIAQRRENLLRAIGYDIVNRRLQRIARGAEPPFRGAGFGTGEVFEAARSSRLIIDTVDGQWRAGLIAAGKEYRTALTYGFSDSEVAEQVAQMRSAISNAATSAPTRSNAVLAQLALSLVENRMVPATPSSALERFESFAPSINARSVLAALKREAIALDEPLIRFQGRVAPDGGGAALKRAWREVTHAPIRHEKAGGISAFGYTDFGPPGTVVTDTRKTDLGIREVRFANGVMLNLRRTDLDKGKVFVSLAIDGGDRLNTRANPHATQLVSSLDDGGLGKHSRDELDTILAGRSVRIGLASAPGAFVAQAATTQSDLETQLQLMTTLITDPGYRLEGEVRYRQGINNYFAQRQATPSSALSASIGGILSDNDPRFSLGPVEDYRQLSFAKLKTDIGDRLANGAIEIGIVGDLEEDAAIALVARTLGALPARDAAFHDMSGQPPRTFTKNTAPRIIPHTGPEDQALLQITWPTRDDDDPVEALQLDVLERVMRVELTDKLREALGKAYSPSAASQLSHDWKGYGTFSVTASVAVSDITATRAAIDEVVRSLRTSAVSDDILRRARQPMLEAYANALKSNSGWLSLVSRAQSEPQRIERFEKAEQRLSAITPTDLQVVASRYLAPDRAVEVLVVPKEKVRQLTGVEAPMRSSTGTSSSK